MKYLIAYGIGLILGMFIYMFAPSVSTSSRLEWKFFVFIRAVIIPFGLGMTVMYLTGRL